MRDLLDTSDHVQREGRVSEATRLAEKIVDFGRATENLAGRCLAFVEHCGLADSIPLAFLGYLGTSSEAFPDVATSNVRGLRKGLDACLGRYDHELRDVSAVLLGQAASAALVQGLKAADSPADALVPRLFQLCGEDFLAYDVLTANLEEALREDEPARKAMLGYLLECVEDINGNPGKFVYESDREPFDSYVREWCESPSIVDLWRGYAGQQFLPGFDHLNFVDAVLAAAPAETLRALDGFRFPQPLDWILTSTSIRQDRGRMTELVRLAPSSVDGDGMWNGSVLALLCLKEADNHCRDLWRASHQNGIDFKEVQELLPVWLTQLAAVVANRNDGVFLATQWLLMKSMDERFERGSRDEDGFLPQWEMVGWVGSGLVEAGLKGRDIANAGHPNVDAEAGSLDVLASIAMLDQLDDNTVPDCRMLLSRLDDLLASRDPSFEAEANFDIGVTGFVDSTIGHLLAMEDCPDRWKQSWDRLTEQRRIAQHWHHTKDSTALAPSLFLVRAGLAALDWLCSESFDRRHVAQTLWRTLFDAVRECWLTISLTHLTESIERDIGRLFCRHPAAFGASAAKPDANRPYSQLLADDLGALGGDDALMARCCELVSRNLQDQAHLHHALRCNSRQGRAVLEQFVRWQKLERRVKKQPQLCRAVETILAEMG